MSLKPQSRTAILVSVVAAVVGAIFGRAIVQWLGLERTVMLVSGGAAGAICGLLPFLLYRKKSATFGKIAIWSCVASGLVLGLLLALPVAFIFTAVGFFKYKDKPGAGVAEPPLVEPAPPTAQDLRQP